MPKGATRLFLGTMDGFEWNNNRGEFLVTVTIERTDVTSNMFSVDSQITFAQWNCLPDRSPCTPDRPVIKELAPGHYLVVLPAQTEWGASIPTPADAAVTTGDEKGTVCLDSRAGIGSRCNGPEGDGTHAGAGFPAPDQAVGALVRKTEGGRTYFSVNDRGGAFQKHLGYFQFDVTVK